uniref:Uncharacterized protein n=1 Tax=Tetraselmis sp. GSL018 TaxID=582737 RepID=A0A061S5Y5_9CHLO
MSKEGGYYHQDRENKGEHEGGMGGREGGNQRARTEDTDIRRGNTWGGWGDAQTRSSMDRQRAGRDGGRDSWGY